MPSSPSFQPFLTAATRYVAIIGDPIEHSMTPLVQNAALCEMGVDVRNIAFHVTAENLATVVAGGRAAGLLGLMVTIPHKVAALSLVDEIDSFGKTMGAINLIHFSREGTRGYNTDGYAASRSLEEQGISIPGARVTILGAGGAGRCLANKFAADGAASVIILNRTEPRARALAEEVARQTGASVHSGPLTPAALAAALPKTDVLVNTTPVGMSPHTGDSPVPAELLRPGLAVYDIVYNPVETRLLREAKKTGCRTADGVGMLVYTNERAVQICVGEDPPVSTMMAVCREALAAEAAKSP